MRETHTCLDSIEGSLPARGDMLSSEVGERTCQIETTWYSKCGNMKGCLCWWKKE